MKVRHGPVLVKTVFLTYREKERRERDARWRGQEMQAER